MADKLRMQLSGRILAFIPYHQEKLLHNLWLWISLDLSTKMFILFDHGKSKLNFVSPFSLKYSKKIKKCCSSLYLGTIKVTCVIWSLKCHLFSFFFLKMISLVLGALESKSTFSIVFPVSALSPGV